MANIPSETPLEKTNFAFASRYQLQITFRSSMRAYVHLALSVLGPHVVWTCAGHVCVATVSEFICASVLLCLEDIVSLESSGSYSLSISSSTRHLTLDDIPFRTECSNVSQSLHIVQLWVSLLVPICFKKKLLWWRLSKTLNYVYSNMSLDIILSLCSFCK